MTALVNTETGEISEPLSHSEAERLTMRISLKLDSLADAYMGVMPLIREAIERQAFAVLGYRSVGEYVSDRFGGALSKLAVEMRREVVRELTDAGMSTRAIAPVVGVSNKTVHQDLQVLPQVTPQTPASPSLGEDGDEAGQTPEPVAETGATAGDDPASGRGNVVGEAVTDYPEAPAQVRAPAPVIGIDGKTYSRPAPTPKPQRSGEQQNAEENSRVLASSLIFLLAFQHPNQRDTARDEWEVGSSAVSPTNRAYVTPDRMREAARGLLALADEWESTHE